MKIPKTALCVILLFGVSCGDKTKAPPGTPTPAVSPVTIGENGLSGPDRERFYHLPEGSELYPYAWLKALQTTSDQPFMQNPERFGLLSDPGNPQGLPIGLTVANRRGVPLGEMVGVNCAACHVAELQYQNTAFRVDGGQNLFDLAGFYQELFVDTQATVTDPQKLFAFLGRWWQQNRDSASAQPAPKSKAPSTELIPGEPTYEPPSDTTKQLLSRYQNLDDLKKDGDLEKGWLIRSLRWLRNTRMPQLKSGAWRRLQKRLMPRWQRK